MQFISECLNSKNLISFRLKKKEKKISETVISQSRNIKKQLFRLMNCVTPPQLGKPMRGSFK